MSSTCQSIACHEEVLDVCLIANHVGLGVALHSNSLPHETLTDYPFVGLIEPDSSADRYVTSYSEQSRRYT